MVCVVAVVLYWRLVAGDSFKERDCLSGANLTAVWQRREEPPYARGRTVESFLSLRVDGDVQAHSDAKQRLGARMVATWLNDRGHRTRSGKPWSYRSVYTVLRNRVYLGEIFFRNEHHAAPHPPLVDSEVFDAAQALLKERGEDQSKRASSPSEYLLSGVVICGRCEHHYVGGAARRRNARSRYYTCFTRHRYGTSECDRIASRPRR